MINTSAPFIWAILPVLIGVVLLLVRKWERTTSGIGIFVTLGLLVGTWLVPLDESIRIWRWGIRVVPVLSLLGRQIQVNSGDLTVVRLLFLATAVFLFGGLGTRPGRLFVPISLMVLGMAISALNVIPFLYGGLFLLVAVLFTIPLLAPVGKNPTSAVLRFLTFQSLGMPFILLAGWLIESSATPGILGSEAIQATILIGFGFALLLGVFPFHTWIPMLAEQTPPFVAAYVLYFFPLAVALFGVGFINQYTWLAASSDVHGMLRSVGFVMVLVGGVSVIFQKNLGRMFGFAVLVDLGCSLLAMGVKTPDGRMLFFNMALLRLPVYLVIGLGLVRVLGSFGTLDISRLEGRGWRYPMLFSLLVAGFLALAGFPGLGHFPARWEMAILLSSHYSSFAFGMVIGSVGIVFITLRSLMILFGPPTGQEDEPEKWYWMGTYAILGVSLLVLGIFPGIYSIFLKDFPAAYPLLFR